MKVKITNELIRSYINGCSVCGNKSTGLYNTGYEQVCGSCLGTKYGIDEWNEEEPPICDYCDNTRNDVDEMYLVNNECICEDCMKEEYRSFGKVWTDAEDEAYAY